MAVHTFPVVNPRTHHVGIAYIIDRLAMREATIRTVVARVRVLIADKGFPPPLGYRQWKGELLDGAAAVTMRSFWRRDAVDAFFDGHGTAPAQAATLAERELATHRTALDARAGGLAA